ncbi:MAG: aminotransferase class IV [Thermoleophilia bacterium]
MNDPKSDSGGYVHLNGRLVPAADAVVSVFDRGFAYGDGLVETMKLSEGRPVFFEEHYRRLGRGCAATGIVLPPGEGLLDAAIDLAAANGVSHGRLRLQLTRGLPPHPEGLDPAAPHEPTLLVTADPFAGYPQRFYREGMSCATVAADRGAWSSLKTSSLIATVLVRREALAAGADEALFTSGHGSLLEGAYTNLFLLSGGVWRTAPETDRILPGVIRDQVLEILAALAIDVEARAPGAAELSAATAAFLTSSLLGCCPVRRIDAVQLEPDRQLAGQVNEVLRQREAASVSRTYGENRFRSQP